MSDAREFSGRIALYARDFDSRELARMLVEAEDKLDELADCLEIAERALAACKAEFRRLRNEDMVDECDKALAAIRARRSR